MKQTTLLLALFFIGCIIHAQQGKLSGAFTEDFSDSILHNFRYGSTGNKAPFKWTSGVKGIEPGSNVLLFKIDPADSAGAGRGPEIISNNFTHFGTYTARLKVPDVKAIQPNTGAVVGYFTYYMDSVYGLSEIDFEWLVADPSIVYIGTWTGYEGQLKRIGRTINLAKGIVYNTVYREGHTGENTPLTGAQNVPETIAAIDGYDASAQFYTYGFDWFSNRLRWWMIHPETGEKIVLWDYQGSQRGIPQHPSYYRMNFWHTNEWSVETNANAIEKPLHPYALEVDWMKYEPFKK
ncbi:glycoside hydrolase family 16 protein [Ilyomonas limi]|uniref:Glycoside hydrolase family 16 protein n=1 Tax=Ilyomonas limi TaxID=2575867 RepID=A0A4U3KWJ8_9BACT|nr:glycoside hydrolase family 16 protein [Ilyomonas limi]TKK66034.1 glycoside hydrolase family 16 protein [Ilyomonas limi]